MLRVDSDTPSIVSNNADLNIGYGSGSGFTGGVTIKNTSGNVGIGTTGPGALLDVAGSEIIRGTSSLYKNTADANPGSITQFKSRGTYASPTTVSNGDAVGLLLFDAHDGTSYSDAAGIRAVVTGTVSAGNVPTALQFYTNKGSGSDYSERVRIDNNGNVGIGTTGPHQKLEVNGNIATGDGTRAFGQGGGTQMLFDRGSNYYTGYNLSVGATSGLFIDSNGNVGIFLSTKDPALNNNPLLSISASGRRGQALCYTLLEVKQSSVQITVISQWRFSRVERAVTSLSS